MPALHATRIELYEPCFNIAANGTIKRPRLKIIAHYMLHANTGLLTHVLCKPILFFFQYFIAAVVNSLLINFKGVMINLPDKTMHVIPPQAVFKATFAIISVNSDNSVKQICLCKYKISNVKLYLAQKHTLIFFPYFT